MIDVATGGDPVAPPLVDGADVGSVDDARTIETGPDGAAADGAADASVRPDAAKYCIYDLDKYDSDCVYAP